MSRLEEVQDRIKQHGWDITISKPVTRLETLQLRYVEYLKCEAAILDGAQSYQVGSRQFNRANLLHIRQMIEYLEREIAVEDNKSKGKGRNRVMGVIPRDF